MITEDEYDTDRRIIAAMQKFGGGFVKALATAALHADTANLNRLKQAFPECWAQYANMITFLNQDSEKDL